MNFLLGGLDAAYLPRLRVLGGLQPYPSRTKDPDQVDYSTGSVGIGATAPVWGAIARRYTGAHTGLPPGGRQISLLGDAELDEGAVWECVADPLVQRLGEVLWVVDLNRQSLDRVVPEMAVGRWQGMFVAAGWQVLEAKYGRRLQLAESSPSIVTPLNKYFGYEATAQVAKSSLKERKTIRQVVLEGGFVERGALTQEQLDSALDVLSMTRPAQ